jgi:hypothetical protein
MAEALGPLVLNVKANMSCDIGAENHKDGSMDRMSETEETAAFISRVRSAREARFPDQKPMLVILDLDQGTYKQYETRTPLPRRYIPKFCAACGVTVEWLLTARHLHRHDGRGLSRGPLPQPEPDAVVAKVLLERSPLHAWHAHPKLNPDYQHDDATKFDIGNIAHKMLLGRGKEIVVLEDFDDWRTKAAKEARARSRRPRASWRCSASTPRAPIAWSMPRARSSSCAGSATCSAPTATARPWSRGEDGFWLRQMIDWLSDDRLIFADYKTTDESAAPDALARKMVNDGWHIQAAMGERGLSAASASTRRASCSSCRRRAFPTR